MRDSEDIGREWGGRGDTRLCVFRFSVFILPLAVYVFTLCPTCGPGDAAELAASGAVLGISHPTGYPLYTLISRLFVVMVPWGTPAARVNLVSAVTSALALLLLFESIRGVLKSEGAAWAASMILAFCRSWWLASVSAEVYSTGAFFLALLIWLALRIRKSGSVGAVLFLAYVFGLSLTHHVTAALAAPFLLASTLPALRRNPRVLPASVAAFAAPLTLYAYLPIRAGRSPAFAFGDPRGWEGLWNHVTGAGYRGNILPAGFQTVEAGLRALPGFLAQGIPFFLLWVPVLGLVALWRTDRRLVGLLALLTAPYLAFPLLYAVPDVGAYFLPVHLSAAFLTAAGFHWLGRLRLGAAESGSRPVRVGVSAVAAAALAAVLLWNLPWCDRSRHRLAEIYGRGLLETAEMLSPGCATLFALGDHAVFPTAYLQVVEKAAPEVTVYDQSGSIHAGPIGARDARAPAGDLDQWAEFERRTVLESPGSVFFSQREKVAADVGVPYRAAGLLFQPRAEPCPPAVLDALWASYGFPEMRDPHLYADIASRVIGGVYFQQRALTEMEAGDREGALEAALSADEVAGDVSPVQARQVQVYLSLGDTDRALRSADRAARLSPGSALALNNLGNLYSMKGRSRDAEAAFLEALRIDPALAAAHANLASVYFRAGRMDACISRLERAIELEPSMINARYNLAMALAVSGRAEEARAELERLLRIQPAHGPARALLESLRSGTGIPPGAAMRLTFTY